MNIEKICQARSGASVLVLGGFDVCTNKCVIIARNRSTGKMHGCIDVPADANYAEVNDVIDRLYAEVLS